MTKGDDIEFFEVSGKEVFDQTSIFIFFVSVVNINYLKSLIKLYCLITSGVGSVATHTLE